MRRGAGHSDARTRFGKFLSWQGGMLAQSWMLQFRKHKENCTKYVGYCTCLCLYASVICWWWAVSLSGCGAEVQAAVISLVSMKADKLGHVSASQPLRVRGYEHYCIIVDKSGDAARNIDGH